ncbi:hypothetical protein ACT3CD_16265 [Geofilum sp. OHC36d9]|uniref:hypothetical protein n=1 Tax=Geofilum sp. OHC36d9 TaxID=3458413 RepID=UPI004034C4D3
MNTPLSDIQKQRLKILEPKLEVAIKNQDIQAAKALVLDLQVLLRPTNHFVRLSQSKNKLFELSIELGDYDFAINGLNSNREVLNKNTRIYLETTSLMAICYVRMQEIIKAKPYIKEVLTNKSVIKSDRTRKIFHKEIINRFNEEVALCTLKSSDDVSYNEDEIEQEVIRIIQTLTEQEIFAQIGQASPRATKELMFLVYDYSTKQLPSAERLALPSPTQKIKDTEVGQTVFESVKRVIYNSLCNPESDIYKTWFNNGMKIVLSKGYIRSAVISCLVNLGVGIKMIAASIIALIMKLGIEIYCERYKPISLMEIRDK